MLALPQPQHAPPPPQNVLAQGVIQSAFLWGYMATQVAGGALADKYGGKAVLAGGMVWFSIASLLLPVALSPAVVAAGLTVPAMLLARCCVVGAVLPCVLCSLCIVFLCIVCIVCVVFVSTMT